VEVKAGYKQTDVGVIPEDWKIASLLNVVDFANGKPHEANVTTDGRYSLITLDSIGIDGGLKSEHKLTNVWDSSLKKNDIVAVLSDIAHGDLLGLCDLVPEDDRYVLNQRMGRLRLKVPADPLFVRLQVNRSQTHFRKRGQGTSQRHIYKRDFESLEIPFPSDAEQCAIAAALSDVDALLKGLTRLIAKKRDLKQAAMQQLLAGQTRLPGFHGEWEVKRLGDIAPLQRGFDLPTSQLRAGPVPVVYSNGVLNFHAQFQANGPGVVTGRSGTIGKVTFVEGAYWPHNTALWVTSFKNNDPRFVFYLYTRIGFARFATGSGVPTLNRNDVHSFEAAIPPTKAEQTKIATVLADMDAELAVLEARRDKTRALKQAMMQELLTGRTRLV
jgi:type I restriction enzyme, S subunit